MHAYSVFNNAVMFTSGFLFFIAALLMLRVVLKTTVIVSASVKKTFVYFLLQINLRSATLTLSQLKIHISEEGVLLPFLKQKMMFNLS